MVFVYVLRGSNGKRYVGITNNIERRLAEHRTRRTKAGQILGEFVLVMSESHPDYASARKREVFLKSGQGRKWLDENTPRPLPAIGGQGLCA